MLMAAGILAPVTRRNVAMGYWSMLPQDVLTALAGAIAASVVAAVSGFMVTRIAKVRRWFEEGRLGASLVVSFLMSVLVAGMMGLFLRHLTWEEVHPLKQALADFSIVAAGQVDQVANQSCKGQITDKFHATKEDAGLYEVCLNSPVAQDSLILLSPLLTNADKPTDIVTSRVVNIHHVSFTVQTTVNGSAADRGFWFLVLHQGAAR
jgi:hypothetical protein